MDTWAEERREVLESVLDTLKRGPAGDDSAACRFLLRHLVATVPNAQAVGYDIAKDTQYERCRHSHPFS